MRLLSVKDRVRFLVLLPNNSLIELAQHSADYEGRVLQINERALHGRENVSD